MDQLMKMLTKEFGAGNVRVAADLPELDVITTGSATLDFATRVGGIPRGSLVELWGAPGLGKTTLSYYMIAAEQKKGNQCVFVNLEGMFSADWAYQCAGVDPDTLILVEPDNAEEAVTAVIKIANFTDRSGKGVSLTVFDSIGAMIGTSELADDGKVRVGGQAMNVQRMCNSIRPLVRQSGGIFVFLNQVRDVMGYNAYGFKTPGGNNLEHMVDYRFQLKPGKQGVITDSVFGQDKEVGKRVTALVLKSKYATKGAYGEFTLYHDKDSKKVDHVGIDQRREVIDLAFLHSLIVQNGRFYDHPLFAPDEKGRPRIEGKENVLEFLTQNPSVVDKLREELMEIAKGDGNE